MSRDHSGQRPRDAVAQHARVANVEIQQMARLQREQVRRVVDRDLLQHAAGHGSDLPSAAIACQVARSRALAGSREAVHQARATGRPAGSVPSRCS